MTLYSRQLVFPDGDTQEIDHGLRINQLVDLNGIPLAPPLPAARMIVYRVTKITTDTPVGEEITNYHLELVRMDELREFLGDG